MKKKKVSKADYGLWEGVVKEKERNPQESVF